MKRLYIIVFCLLVWQASALANNGKDKASKSKLHITIDGLKAEKGQVIVAISHTEENFKLKNDCYKGYFVKVNSKNVDIVVDDLPVGEYAIKAYHDLNNNGKLDKTIFGIPCEPYTFSNNAKGFMGLPDYKEAKFEVKSGQERISLNF